MAGLGQNWIEEPNRPDFAYSMAVIGDPQVINGYHPEHYAEIYDYVLRNRERDCTKLAIVLGDVTERSQDEEWARVRAALTRWKAAELPFTVIRGNPYHDRAPLFNEHLGDLIREQYDGLYAEDDVCNGYRLITVGQTDYLILGLDFGPEDAVLAWAGEVCAQYPDRRVIVVTHGYLNRGGELIKRGEDYVNDGGMAYHGAKNGGIEIWDKLIACHENIVMVLCGHVGENGIEHTVRVGNHGNRVVELLIDPQDIDDQVMPTGMVATLFFSADGKRVTVHNYSTVQKRYYGDVFTVEVDGVR
ncbi:MAG: hypothetical protein IJP14_07030 [Clostridia bacterium]|nr:hypothetical protein [Clostridia bacterium]